ncbi:MAG: Uridine phosphorylase [Candidatus Ozemobacter sibiricus]|jgi:uridine phosphorylase|uniref:Uridine phosphorylase n=1 Tax=Candidatus Ozemobacter sibiricus TaxID=2268124 RepID=A0A367ZLQ0_9BACT|nr:MAG: Uridine phosphorylase [Candidatus Ozemobacter sibiricus]
MQPHVKLAPGQIPPYVLVCGDPARAEQIARLMQDPKELAYNREYRTFVGTYEGERLAVTSHGVGSAGAAICFEELIKVGARVLIRVGTCGSLTDKLGQGDHIVASAAVREDGVSSLLIPLGYPAVADLQVIQALEKACQDVKAPYQRGIILASDVFYPGLLPTSLELYSKANVPGVEMECATLFVIASLRGVKAGAIATVDGNPLKWQEGDYDPHGEKVAQGKARMLKIGLAAMAALSRAKV